MKIKNILHTLLCSLMISISFTACSDSTSEEEEEIIATPVKYPIYILNEGNWGSDDFFFLLRSTVTTSSKTYAYHK